MGDWDIKGNLKITKVYADTGEEEVVYEDSNVIVSGLGVALSYLYSGSGSQNIVDYQVDRFQVGIGGTASLQISSTYQLGTDLSSISEYTGSYGKVIPFISNWEANGAVGGSSKIFAKIPFSHVTRVDNSVVKYTLAIDQDSCNDILQTAIDGSTQRAPLNEIGLFMKNPSGNAQARSILIAYKYFGDIAKTNNFSLIFDWTLHF